jgi:BirA family biotin operon repressor/biotin-[acetyl-CoA-carboxylase] ligase
VVASDRTPPDPWAGPWPPRWTVEHVTETGSTNADLLDAASSRPHRSVLVADHQTAGRGRLDRSWVAPAGENLLVSLLFRADAGEPDGHSDLLRRVSLAAVDGCRVVAPDTAGGDAVALKWPNDLLLHGAKLAGVLAQRDGDGNVVVGLGLNVGWCPPGAARLGPGVSRLDLLAELLAAFDRLPPGPAELHQRYRAELGTLNRWVRVERPAGPVVGRATDVDVGGRLLVVDAGGVTHRFDAGDVTHLR